MARDYYTNNQVVLLSQGPLGQIMPEIRPFGGFPVQYLEPQYCKLMEEKM